MIILIYTLLLIIIYYNNNIANYNMHNYIYNNIDTWIINIILIIDSIDNIDIRIDNNNTILQ